MLLLAKQNEIKQKLISFNQSRKFMFILQSDRIQTKNAVKHTFFKPKKDAFLYEKTQLQIRRKINFNIVFCTVFVNSFQVKCLIIGF